MIAYLKVLEVSVTVLEATIVSNVICMRGKFKIEVSHEQYELYARSENAAIFIIFILFL